jgi:hypothetical protein
MTTVISGVQHALSRGAHAAAQCCSSMKTQMPNPDNSFMCPAGLDRVPSLMSNALANAVPNIVSISSTAWSALQNPQPPPPPPPPNPTHKHTPVCDPHKHGEGLEGQLCHHPPSVQPAHQAPGQHVHPHVDGLKQQPSSRESGSMATE